MGIFGNTSTVFDQQLDKATDECNTEEDWGLIMTLCDKIKSTPDGPREFCRAVLKKINHKVPHVALQALTVLDSCVNNCGIDFKKEVASQDFINSLRHVMMNSHPKVAAHLKMLIRQWAEEFKDDAQLSRLTSFYHFMRSEGVEFPTKDEIDPPKKSAAPVSKDPNVVSSQQEADDIAKAIEMSLKEEKQKKGLSSSVSNTLSTTATSNLYPTMLGGSASTSTHQSTSYTSGHSSTKKKKVKAIYDFEAAEDNELTFKAGDLIEILDDSDANWWKGEGSNGSGLFPANFVTTDLSVEPEPEFGVSKKKEEEEDQDGRSVSFNEEVEVKEVDLAEPVLEINEQLMDKTLVELQNTDPESELLDTMELIRDEETCMQMGPLIDAKLEDVDRKHLEYTQLNDKILEALNMYDKLMNEMPIYNPPMQNPYMKNLSAYTQQMMVTPQAGYATAANPNMYNQPMPGQIQQINATAGTSNPQMAGVANTTTQYSMYHQPGAVYSAHNGMQQPPPMQHQGIPRMMNQTPPNQPTAQSNYPQQHIIYSDPSSNTVVHSTPSYSNQNTLHQQQYSATGYTQAGGPGAVSNPYSTNAPPMQPMM